MSNVANKLLFEIIVNNNVFKTWVDTGAQANAISEF